MSFIIKKILTCVLVASLCLVSYVSFASDTSYSEHLQKYDNEKSGEGFIKVSGETGLIISGKAEQVKNTKYNGGLALATYEDSIVSWNFDIPKTGLYNITFLVTTESKKRSTAQRSLLIDGELPFDEARELAFYRYWSDTVEGENFSIDRMGNDLRPESTPQILPIEQLLRAPTGDAYSFYFTKGNHELSLKAGKELLVIDELIISGKKTLPNYSEVLDSYKEQGVEKIESESLFLEAEKYFAKSDYSIHPVFDRTSPATTPQSSTVIRLNAVGGGTWQTVGQWIEWVVDIPKTGLYNINFRFKQSSLRGLPVSRALLIDGKIPFAEAQKIIFPYGNDWQNIAAGEPSGEGYLFYFEKGVRTIRLQVVLGDLYSIVTKVKSSLTILNSLYRSILAVTGPAPDVNRDYDFDIIMPEVLEGLAEQSKVLSAALEDLMGVSGQQGEMLSILETLIDQLDHMVQKPYEIAKQFSVFKSNLSALGNWIFQISNQPLYLDSLNVSAGENAYEDINEGFLSKMLFNIRLFMSSFLIDYNTFSSEKEALEVWVPTGRDQWQIISNMADYDFANSTGIPVSVKLVAPTALLPSVLAGRGPDAALSNLQNVAVEFAARGASSSLTGMDGLEEVKGRFAPSSLLPLHYRDELYGIPENQSWPMMFCRNDILDELGLTPPKTWDQVISSLPVIKRSNMQFGMLVGYPGFLQLLYQNGGTLYRDENVVQTALDSNESMSAFVQLCNLFTQYKLPIEYDAANRFRSGEMPILIAEYTFYNQLAVFAPEIMGLWQMTPVPGIVKSDGSIDNTAVSTTTSSIILQTSQKKEDAWEFLKWWTSEDIQTNFAIEMEAVMGPSAKQPTANLNALGNLAWTISEFTALEEQRKKCVGIPVIPGHYQAERLVGFAFINVYRANSDPAEKLEDTILSINNELARRRRELGGTSIYEGGLR